MSMTEAIDLTLSSLQAYGETHRHWVVAWSGGKDSTALVTLVVWAIQSGKVKAPTSLTVLYADTRLELLPLWHCAATLRGELAEAGVNVQVVMAPLDLRFLVYMLGRGVPPPSNRMRWCTEKIKVDPMERAMVDLAVSLGLGRREPKVVQGKERLVYVGNGQEKLLLLHGVRQGESAVRDGRIAMSCGRDGAECGQGWYQETLPEALCDKLGPVLHWRVCHVFAWLKDWAPRAEFGDWTTRPLADAYGGDEAEEIAARTGCVGCPLVQQDRGLETMLRQPAWAYLAPLRRLRPLWATLRSPLVRLRKRAGERRVSDGELSKNQQRQGPIVLDKRLSTLEAVLAIQAEVNAAADALKRPRLDLLNAEEEARIRELVATETWPDGWNGDEPLASELVDAFFSDGTSQPLLPWDTK